MIRFHNVVKKFRRQRVLDGLNLDIARGERIALVGSNGAGKTTLIRCLLGEYTFDGQISIEDQPVRAARRALLGRIGFVPQLPPPLKMPVGQLLSFAAQLCHSDPARMEAITARLGLDARPVWHRPFNKLSGGQKQKLLIGIALGRDSEILVLDEPTANLDPPARRIVFELLAERQEHAVMLISSHRLDEVAALVNRVVELDRGQVILDDRVADAVELASALDCRIGLSRAEPAFARALEEWHFRSVDAGTRWEGQVAGPDRLRFLGTLSRYAGLLAEIHWAERRAE